MLFIHTIASLILAHGVAAIPAPAPHPEAEPIIDDFEPRWSTLGLSPRDLPSVTAASSPTTETPAPEPSPIVSCATIDCQSGYVCREIEGRPGCYEQQICGKGYCPWGTSCCNRSCSVCTPPNVSCTQQICNKPDKFDAPVEVTNLLL
ncbi:hypothetical protein LY76DRAFT_595817 [Colletotrichum caudatum]|nr:hypothetical protein LY76DRAFT_595817 [Colletotrichum caudatum]